jgi:hypothetical protein
MYVSEGIGDIGGQNWVWEFFGYVVEHLLLLMELSLFARSRSSPVHPGSSAFKTSSQTNPCISEDAADGSKILAEL